MLSVKIKDFLLHGGLDGATGTSSGSFSQSDDLVADKTAQLKSTADSFLAGHSKVIEDENKRHEIVVAYAEHATDSHEGLAGMQIENHLKDIQKQQLVTNLMAMAGAVQHLELLCEDLRQSGTSTDDRKDHVETYDELKRPDSTNTPREAAMRAIPQRVFEVFSTVPPCPGSPVTLNYLPRRSKVFAMLLSTVAELKEVILVQFHAQFEDILSSSGTSGDSTVGNRADKHGHLWGSFLTSSRDWLLAYSLLCMLPVALTEPPTAVESAYLAAIDEALLPLWGRFDFHLKQASGAIQERRSAEASSEIRTADGSKQQVLWTFQYCISHAQLLVDLCTQITVGSRTDTTQRRGHAYLEKFLTRLQIPDTAIEAEDKATASHPSRAGTVITVENLRRNCQIFLINKCVRFFQAHLADVLMTVTANGGLKSKHQRAYMLHLVEQTLTLDTRLGDLLQQSAAGSSARIVLKQACIEVFCAAKPLYVCWLRADMYFVQNFASKSVNIGALSDFMDRREDKGCTLSGDLFETIFAPAFGGKNSSDSTKSTVSSQKMRCYQGPYEVMRLFRLTAERYSAIPTASAAHVQALFSTFILEPLLHLLVSLLLLRLRYSVALSDLSDGILPLAMRHYMQSAENEQIVALNMRKALATQDAEDANDFSFFDNDESDASDAERDEQEASSALHNFPSNNAVSKSPSVSPDAKDTEPKHEPSIGRKGDDGRKNFIKDAFVQEIQSDLQEFYDSVEYLQHALSACGAAVRCLRCRGYNGSEQRGVSFYESRWRSIHAWLPHETTIKDPFEQRNILKKLFKRVFLEGTDEEIADLMDASKAQIQTKVSTREEQGTPSNAQDNTLSASIDMCRAQLITLSNILRLQEKKAYKHLHHS